MKIKPILFNTEMVTAILDGRKTVTRRLSDRRIVEKYLSYEEFVTSVASFDGCTSVSEKEFYEQRPPCSVGDILWVRETWCDDRQFTHDDTPGQYFYKANFPIEGWSDVGEWKWRPSIHMPKTAARIFLKVTNVRVERLQDLTEGQAIKEGVEISRLDLERGFIHIDKFADLWNSTVKEDWKKWFANPYVWVIEFERCEKPEG